MCTLDFTYIASEFYTFINTWRHFTICSCSFEWRTLVNWIRLKEDEISVKWGIWEGTRFLKCSLTIEQNLITSIHVSRNNTLGITSPIKMYQEWWPERTNVVLGTLHSTVDVRIHSRRGWKLEILMACVTAF